MHRRRDLAPLGIALHHFTDLVAGRADLDDAELHQATTVLTRQVRRAMATPEPFGELVDVLTDPSRPALADGRPASALCGRAWASIGPDVARRVWEAAAGTQAYGAGTILALAELRAHDAAFPWWGTDAWAQHVHRWALTRGATTRLRSSLLQAPDQVDAELVRDVLVR